MGLSIPGSTSSSGVQAIQGMSKGSPVHGSSSVIKQGVAAKGTIKVPKSKKKKVIVNALLGMMNSGHMAKQRGGGKIGMAGANARSTT